MSEEILINVTQQETRVAMVENGVLQEVSIERTRKRGLVGNIYKGRVSRVMPGMDAAFVDIGLQKAAFLHASDIAPSANHNYKLETITAEPGNHSESVTQLLYEGQELLVQVLKDQLGTKGARLTTQITIASHYLVLMPNSVNVGISTRIEDEEGRQRLKMTSEQLATEVGLTCGYIVRTAAESASDEDLLRDM